MSALPSAGKFTNWEGGTRVRAFVASANPAIIPARLRGTQHEGLFHSVDIYPTSVSLLGLDAAQARNHTGPVAMDGVDQSSCLLRGGVGCREEIFYAPVVETAGLNPMDCQSWGQSCGGAIRVGDFKLIVGSLTAGGREKVEVGGGAHRGRQPTSRLFGDGAAQ